MTSSSELARRRAVDAVGRLKPYIGDNHGPFAPLLYALARMTHPGEVVEVLLSLGRVAEEAVRARLEITPEITSEHRFYRAKLYRVLGRMMRMTV